MDVSIAQSKKKIAELLIEHGADVNDRSKYGVTPLYKAATKEMAELLIKHGANVNANEHKITTHPYMMQSVITRRSLRYSLHMGQM